MAKRSIWTCNFCTDNLVRNSFRGLEWFLLLFLHRPHYCPHCFKTYWRLMTPFGPQRKKKVDHSRDEELAAESEANEAVAE